MGVYFVIDPDHRLVSYVIEGDTTVDQVRAFLAGVLTHPDYEPGFDFLGDAREVATQPDSIHVRWVAWEVRHRAAVLGPCRWAILVGSEVGFGMTRMLEFLTDDSGVSVRPFWSESEAVAWLEMPVTYSPLLLVSTA